MPTVVKMATVEQAIMMMLMIRSTCVRARILGASRIKAFFKVTFPLSLDGIGTGFIIVFLLANGSFVTLLLLGGGELRTLPLLIYQQFTISRDFQFAAAMSNVLLAIAVGCLYLQLRLIKRKGVQG